MREKNSICEMMRESRPIYILQFPVTTSSFLTIHIIFLVSLGSTMASFKVFLSFLLMFLVVCSALDMSTHYDQLDSAFPNQEDDVRALFEMWRAKEGRLYTAIGEKEKRFEIFKDNLKFIIKENAKGHPYKLGLTKFVDLTHEEFLHMYGRGFIYDPEGPLSKNISSSSEGYAYKVADVPASVDWRQANVISRVIDQGECGSCWAWATVGAVESLLALAKGQQVLLSAQELVDCVQNCNGCVGGWPDRAMDFIIRNGGIDSDQDWPYMNNKYICNDQKRMYNKVATIDGYVGVRRFDEMSLQMAVAQQPVTVAVDMHDRSWPLYTGGLYTANCGTNLNHAIIAIGYGTYQGMDYWIVKNSWGTNWGESGFMYIQRNVNDRSGKCGIAMYPYYPTISGYSGIFKGAEVTQNISSY